MVVLLGTFFALTQRRSVSAEKLSLEISVAKAHEYYSSGTLMLDVREPEEYESGHIPGSLLIPLGELPDRLSELARDEPIVVVCRSGNRSTTGRDILKRAGYEEVTSMAGGMNQWKQLGYEIEFGAKP
ncbi:MAG: hypothetical protein BGO78_01790 [Chloroflexi bacterium 44-23]|nr:MAG: hypothetical protein BGO78_01790 [Chloroflexi bacterium 44-23]